MPVIDILLATYNAEKHLADQLDSLFNQSHAGWRLIVRDDGSTDATGKILADYQRRHPDAVVIIEDRLGNLGACGNFARLLEMADADYVMCCDQDDVWMPDKIERTFRRMEALETTHGSSTPCLVYTDLQVVDDHLKVLSNSFYRMQAYDPGRGFDFSRLLVGNVMVGCTVMINRRLRDLAMPMPPEALMHDWWLGLLACACGRVAFLNEATILYRQHAGNVVGATWANGTVGMLKNMFNLKKHRRYLLQTQRQAEALSERYQGALPEEYLRTARIYATLDRRNWMRRRLLTIKCGFWWSGVLRNAMLLLVL